ncbi:MAG: alpha/beta fold hydrolase [Solirubrobacteraceae bacterium]
MASRRPPRALTISVAAAGTAAGIALQLRHLRRVARDPDYAMLTAPLDGRAVVVISPDGTRLHAEIFGPEDGATVVLAHGWTEELAFWGPVIRLLRDAGLRAVAYDLRGHGASGPATDHDYSLERFGEDLEAVLVATTPEQRLPTVAGHSLGAMSIAAWAEHHDVSARARAAALINAGLGDLIAGHLLFGDLVKRLESPLLSRLVLGSRTPLPPFSTPVQQAVIRHAAFGPTATAGQVAFYEQMLIGTPREARAASGVALTDMNLWHAVARLTIPTLVVAGERDRLTPPAHARRIAETLPHPAGLLVLPETGHMGPLERPQEVAAALIELSARP